MDFFNIDFIIRILVALILGFALGLERELTNKYAGLRTHILVCMGACIFTIISIYGFPTFAPGDNVIVEHTTGVRDTARIAAQIVTGIGFIGAGTVLRNGPVIIGLTTAATLWISASIGMACGVGMYDIAIIATLLSVAVLTLIRVFERKFLSTSIKRAKKYKISTYCKKDDICNIQEFINNNTEHVEEFATKKLIDNPEKSKLSVIFELSNKKNYTQIYKELTDNYDTDSISMQEIND